MKYELIRGSALSAMLALGSAHAVQIELVTNGGFETGNLNGWTVSDLPNGSGSWFINDLNGMSPLSAITGAPSRTIGPPASGNFYAVSDQEGPGTHALEQSFVVPIDTVSIVVSFDMFRLNSAGSTVIDPAGLDHTIPRDNQHGRVDIITAFAGSFSTAATDVVTNLVPPGSDGGTYIPYSLDITSLVSAGETYRLRFAETDNFGFFNQGVDNVSIIADVQPAASVPVPSALLLILAALAGVRHRARTSAT